MQTASPPEEAYRTPPRVGDDPGARPGGAWVGGLVTAAVLLLALKIAGAGRVLDLDMFHQMAWFREALSTGRAPLADVWAYTPTLPVVVHHEWGMGAVLYAAAIATGWGAGGIAALRLLLFAGIIALTYTAARRRGANGAVMAVLAPIALYLFGPGLAPVRAQMFTFLFVALLMVCLEADRRGVRSWVWGWLAVCLLWVNLHGGFVAGYALFALYTVERFAQLAWEERSHRPALRQTAHLWAAGAAMALFAGAATPYGLENVTYLRDALSLERVHIGEWAPLWAAKAHKGVQATFALSVLFGLYAAVRARGAFPGAALLLASAWMAAEHLRFAPLYAIVWFAYVPAALTPTPFREILDRLGRSRSAVAAAALFLAALSGWSIAKSPAWSLRLPTSEANAPSAGWIAPVGPVAYLRESGFRGNLMTHFEVGAFVSWNLHPAVRVGMDSRYEAAYPAGALEEHLDFFAGRPGWERTLARHPTQAVLVPQWSPLDSLLPERAGWKRVYRDDSYAVIAHPDVAAQLPSVDRAGEPFTWSFP